jgi:hypothetical protein
LKNCGSRGCSIHYWALNIILPRGGLKISTFPVFGQFATQRAPLPPFTHNTVIENVRMAETLRSIMVAVAKELFAKT